MSHAHCSTRVHLRLDARLDGSLDLIESSPLRRAHRADMLGCTNETSADNVPLHHASDPSTGCIWSCEPPPDRQSVLVRIMMPHRLSFPIPTTGVIGNNGVAVDEADGPRKGRKELVGCEARSEQQGTTVMMMPVNE